MKHKVETEAVYTTGEVARFTGVNFRTVIRWIERGEMEGYKLPGRGDHRVTQSALKNFMLQHQIPIPQDLETPHENNASRLALVVDDDEQMAKAIARVLRRDGWETSIALDGFEAGLIMVEKNPLLMTLDLKMPRLDGARVLELTREKYDSVSLKILLISGQDKADVSPEILSSADGYLSKPFENEVLLSTVQSFFPSFQAKARSS